MTLEKCELSQEFKGEEILLSTQSGFYFINIFLTFFQKVMISLKSVTVVFSKGERLKIKP
jgi:hypothetical protein